MLKLTADKDEEYAIVEKRLAEAKRQLAEELERANKLNDKQAAADSRGNAPKYFAANWMRGPPT